MKKISILLFVLTVCLVEKTIAQTVPEPILSQADVTRFIATWKPLQQDFEALGDKYKNIDNPNMLQGMAANAEVKAIFKKHGWGDNFYQKVNAIVMGMYAIQLDKVLDEVPADQRESMKQMIEMQKGQLTTAVAEEDIELVRSNFDKLNEIFEEN